MRFLAKLLSAVIPISLIASTPAIARDWNSIKVPARSSRQQKALLPLQLLRRKKLTGYEVDVAEAIAKMGLKLRMARGSVRRAAGRRQPGSL